MGALDRGGGGGGGGVAATPASCFVVMEGFCGVWRLLMLKGCKSSEDNWLQFHRPSSEIKAGTSNTSYNNHSTMYNENTFSGKCRNIDHMPLIHHEISV